MKLAELVLAAMVQLQAPGKSLHSDVVVPEGSPPGCEEVTIFCRRPRYSSVWRAWVRPETAQEGLERYRAIADVTAAVAEADAGRVWCGTPKDLAALLVATQYHESHWVRNVHAGRGRGAMGDRGRSRCLGQIYRRPGRWRTPRGYTWRSLAGVDEAATRRCVETIVDVYAALQSSSCRERCQMRLYMGANAPKDRVRARMGTLWRVSQRFQNEAGMP